MNYQYIYDSLIFKAKSENRKRGTDIYYEGHHIIPICLRGTGSARNTSHPNIVLLTAKEHYIAHRLLVRIYPNNKKLQIAMMLMVNSNNENRHAPSARIFETLKLECNDRLKNRKFSAESRKKMSDAKKGKQPWNTGKRYKRSPHSAETKLKISKSNIGKIVSPETRLKMREAALKRHMKYKLNNN
jgi:hypothetical protein